MAQAGRTRRTKADGKALVALYREMARIREFEEQVQKSYLEGLVHGTTHLCQGQEAVSVGVAAALEPNDRLTYTYRGHGVCIARGMSMAEALGEIFGRVDGVSRGLGGSMHLTDAGRGLIGSFGIVGAGLPCAVGAGLAAQLDGKGRVSVTFFGDGAANIGAVHESMNLAAIWKLPVIFVLENNLYGEFSRINHTTTVEDLADRAAAYAMPGVVVDGNDVLAVKAVAEEAVARARAGMGPTLIEAKTYRHRGHSRTDPAKYRDEKEVKAWLARDPLVLFARQLVKEKHATKADLDGIVEEARAEAARAAETAAASPWPEPRDFTPETFAAP
ncbi:MAG: thiamine pyrophosphate-dependent dehydrogenase E1 component subunit alpha [Azospirillaceae bacterium]